MPDLLPSMGPAPAPAPRVQAPAPARRGASSTHGGTAFADLLADAAGNTPVKESAARASSADIDRAAPGTPAKARARTAAPSAADATAPVAVPAAGPTLDDDEREPVVVGTDTGPVTVVDDSDDMLDDTTEPGTASEGTPAAPMLVTPVPVALPKAETPRPSGETRGPDDADESRVQGARDMVTRPGAVSSVPVPSTTDVKADTALPTNVTCVPKELTPVAAVEQQSDPRVELPSGPPEATPAAPPSPSGRTHVAPDVAAVPVRTAETTGSANEAAAIAPRVDAAAAGDAVPESKGLSRSAKAAAVVRPDGSRANARRAARAMLGSAIPAVVPPTMRDAAAPPAAAVSSGSTPAGPVVTEPPTSAAVVTRARGAAAVRSAGLEATEISPAGVPAVASGEGAGSHGFARDGRPAPDTYVGPHRMAPPHAAGPAFVHGHVLAPDAPFLSRLTQSAAGIPALSPASAAEWGVPGQIVRGLQMQMRGGVGEAVIRLTPEHLGEILVQLTVAREGVVATLKTDTPAVRAWIAAHRDDLEAGLADVGLRLDDLRVSEREAGSDRGSQQPPDDTRRRRPRRQPDTAARFEVVV